MNKLTIKEITERLQSVNSLDDPFLKELELDKRKGAQLALKKQLKLFQNRALLEEKYQRMMSFENEAINNGYNIIAGIDEVGRGPLAGPVVAAAVVLDLSKPILGLDDSKKISAKNRLLIFNEIKENAVAIGIGSSSSREIDQLNILQATKLAMKRAVEELALQPDFLLIDAESLSLPIPQKTIIKGDAHSNSIAAASIIAKVTRDQLMQSYDQKYPGYDFKKNVGYGTKAHLHGLEMHGPSPIHRQSFAPIKKYLN